MIDKVKQVMESHKGQYLYCWSGVFFELEHELIRYDKVFLNVIGESGGASFFRRIAPCVIPGRQREGHEEPYILFSLPVAYRITNNRRKGKVVPFQDLETGERYREAGLSKCLEYGRSPNKFLPSRKNDRVVIELMSNMLEQDTIGNRSVLESAPLFYMTCPGDGTRCLRLRGDQSSLEYIRGFNEFSPALSLDSNIAELKSIIEIDVGGGRIGYPFSFFYGKGVLAAEPFDDDRPMGVWYSIDEDAFACTSNHMEVVM